jgi:hypothetical protein
MRLQLALALLAAGALLLLAQPAEGAGADSATPLYLKRDGLGNIFKLTAKEPQENRLGWWRCSEELNQQGSFFPLAKWEQGLGGQVELGDSYTFAIWVESTNVQEITLRATLYVVVNGTQHNLSVEDVSKQGTFPNLLTGNYTIEPVSELGLDHGDYRTVPAFSAMGIELETSITWAPDTENRTVYIKADSPDFTSQIVVRMRPVFLNPEVFFSNDRTDEPGEDSLYIKASVVDALGVIDDSGSGSVADLDLGSFSLEIEGVSGGGNFDDSVRVRDQHPFAKYIEGRWQYQQDSGISSGTYQITISVTDMRGNIWEESVSYDLTVDEFAIELEHEDGGGGTYDLQLPRGGKVEYRVKVWNRGNTADSFEIEVDDNSLPSGWEATMLTSDELDLPVDQYVYARVRIEAPDGAAGGSSATARLEVTSLNDGSVSERMDLRATVRTYGAVISGLDSRITIDPEALDIDGLYRFPVGVRNTGNDRDSYYVTAIIGRGDWTVRIEEGGQAVNTITVDRGKTKQLEIVLKPVNFENSMGDEVDFRFSAESVPPGDGSALFEAKLIVEIPIERVIDLTIAAVDLQVNGRPYAQLMPGDLQAGAPVQFQLVVKNLGGRGADPFSVKLYVMGRVEASYSVDMGLAGFGEALVLLEWSKPAAGLATLRITADSDLAVEDERNRADNSFSLSLDIAAAPSGNGDSSGDGDGFSIPGFGLAGALISAAIVARRRW